MNKFYFIDLNYTHNINMNKKRIIAIGVGVVTKMSNHKSPKTPIRVFWNDLYKTWDVTRTSWPGTNHKIIKLNLKLNKTT